MNLRSKPVRALAASALLGAVVLTACSSGDSGGDETKAASNGVEDLSAQEILEEATAAVKDATSVRIEGEITQGGTPTAVDLQLSDSGSASGTITVNESTITLIAVDSQVYFSAGADLWTANGAPENIIDQVDGKYIEVPAEDKSFDSFTDFDAFTGELLTAEGKVEKGDESTVDGTPVIELIDSKDQGVLSISLEGEPLPLQVSSGTEGEVQFSDWKASVEVEAPADDEIVDLQSLLGS